MPGLGTSTGMLVSFGVGAAAGAALEPAFEIPKQDAWARNPNRILNLGQLARLVAEGGGTIEEAYAEALRDGYRPSRVDASVYLAQTVPGVPEALDLWRRGLIDEQLFRHALVKSGLKRDYHDPIVRTKTSRRLDPAVASLAIVRGLVPDPGILPVAPPTEVGVVPAFPVFNVDPVAEAAAAGYDKERLSVMVGNMGRPASPVEAANAYWRGKAKLTDYYRAISEGDVRNEWRDVILEALRAIPSPNEAAELRVRGWVPEAKALELAASHGMTHEHAQLLYDLHGRPVNTHAVVTGLARGGHYPGSYSNVPQPFRKAIEESSIREEWAELAYANRYNYPSAFVLRALAEAGVLDEAELEQIFLEIGWQPALAAKVAKRLAVTGTGASKQETASELADEYEGGFITEAEYRQTLTTLGYTGHTLDLLVHLGDARRVKRYREKAIDAIAAAYVVFRLDDVAATTELAAAGVTGDATTQLLAVWKLQRLDTVRTLSAAQLKKAHKAGLLTDAAALQALEWLHYSPADAETYLAE